MNIHSIYSIIFKMWRVKRMERFETILKPEEKDVILDVGGLPGTWVERCQLVKQIDCLNILPTDWNGSEFPDHNIRTLLGDGCELPFNDSKYDIVFSNSVIEHVGDWERQKEFAQEVRRVGRKLWIQTPAYECPLEPHYLAPFVHWLPIWIRRRVLRWLTPWGWLEKPSQKRVDETIAYTQLLTGDQIKELFPDCVVITEKLFWLFPKSYVAYRLE